MSAHKDPETRQDDALSLEQVDVLFVDDERHMRLCIRSGFVADRDKCL